MPPKVSVSAAPARSTPPPLVASMIDRDGEVLTIVGSPGSSPLFASTWATTPGFEGPNATSVDVISSPPRKKTCDRAFLRSVPKSIRAKTKTTDKTPLPSLKDKAKTLIKASNSTQSRGKVKKKDRKAVGDPADCKSMRWTVTLTKLALETRFKNPRILKKFAKKMTDTKKIRATWEATVNLFLERALIEEAWGEGEEGREVSVSQFKNKLNAIRKLYRSKRTRMLATGNRGTGSSSDEDETGDFAPVQRMYPEMPSNYLLQRDDNADLADRNDLTCDPLNVRPEYRKELGNELAALWPLLCDIFSSNPGLTGEAIVESGLKNGNCDGNEDIDGLSNESDSRSEGECSDTPSDARVKAKAAAKLKKQTQQQEVKQVQSELKRPVELLNDTLQNGFTTFGRIFENRNSSQTDSKMVALVEKLTSSIDASNAQHQESTQAICQSIASLQQTTSALFTEMMKQFKKSDST